MAFVRGKWNSLVTMARRLQQPRMGWCGGEGGVLIPQQWPKFVRVSPPPRRHCMDEG
jgi:hypothetical protein